MIKRIQWITLLVLGMTFEAVAAELLSGYPPAPGPDPSPRYSFRVCQVGSDQCMTPFAKLEGSAPEWVNRDWRWGKIVESCRRFK